MMKTTKVQASAVYLDCPYCDEGFTDPSTGSFLITPDTFAAFAAGLDRNVVTCSTCGKQSKLPKQARF